MAGSKVEREVRTFATTTSGLLALPEWLSSLGTTYVAMAATGVYWRPVRNILSDGEFELILANSTHVKNVAGRKTDMNDATRLADLLAHGLIRARFVPNVATQEQRGLLRARTHLTRERTSHVASEFRGQLPQSMHIITKCAVCRIAPYYCASDAAAQQSRLRSGSSWPPFGSRLEPGRQPGTRQPCVDERLSRSGNEGPCCHRHFRGDSTREREPWQQWARVSSILSSSSSISR